MAHIIIFNNFFYNIIKKLVKNFEFNNIYNFFKIDIFQSFDEFMGHVKQGAIEVGTDIFNAAANLFSELLEPSDSSSIDYELSPSYVSEYDGLTLMVTGRHTIILDKQGNTLQKIDENLFRLNDNINLRIK